MVDPTQLESAVLNLCLNARDAMPKGGRLTLETANAALDRRYAEQHADVTPGQYVLLAVSDTGTGIAAAHLSRVFEPFFTTKEKGKGTGLGLAMVYGFVKQSGGHVGIYSEPGQGTTLKLYLPRALGPRAAAERAASELEPRGGAETVLVVEDDEPVRRLAALELRAMGYHVLTAASGAEALQVLRADPPVDLLFTDIVMPGGMTGRELADAACRMRPGLHVLYTSGYTDNAIVHHGRLDAGVQLLSKPYRRADLARAVRQALERPAG
jgi:CheY-like chemotaxis protein